MKKLFFALVVCLSLSAQPTLTDAIDLDLNHAHAQIYFSPKGGCTDALVHEIASAKKEILLQAYSFTSVPIAKAMADASRRGIRVVAVLDKSQRSERYTSATYLSNAQIPTFIDTAHAIAHNKVIIIDGTTVVTGSFNFTKAAEEKNAENLLILRSKELATYYTQNWQKHRDHSEEYRHREA
jgi:phosphatidylserine/phosphatidylglycerophosphate/cardiolipin synthase-like enzyme